MKHRFSKIKTVYSYYTNNHTVGAYPMQVGIELTNNCNLKCVMCPHPRMARQKGFIKKELFEKIIDEIKGKSEFVYLYGMGESLLHPEFFELVGGLVDSGQIELMTGGFYEPILATIPERDAIGQINMLTASSFCGLNGALWGYHLAKAESIASGSLGC